MVVPPGMKLAEEDVKLENNVTLAPGYVLPKDATLAKGQLVPENVTIQLTDKGKLRDVKFRRFGAVMAATAYGKYWFLIGLTVFCALIGVITWGSLAGSMLPFILRRLGFDPATSSAPFVATLVDVTGLIIYFLVAKIILTGTLL